MNPFYDQRPMLALATLAAVSASALTPARAQARAIHPARVFPLLRAQAPAPVSFVLPGHPDFTAPPVPARRRRDGQHGRALELVREMVAAGDKIATLPYIYGGGHGSFDAPGYDCSGSVSYVLHAAGLLSVPEDSSQLESYGVPGPGRYVTIYANAEHAWMTIDGRRFDTIALAETGTRWSDSMMSTDGYVVMHPAGL